MAWNAVGVNFPYDSLDSTKEFSALAVKMIPYSSIRSGSQWKFATVSFGFVSLVYLILLSSLATPLPHSFSRMLLSAIVLASQLGMILYSRSIEKR